MSPEQFFQELDSRIAKHDLLGHPFYKAWNAGELTREDLREYAQDYYHHVQAFPTYLAELAIRLDEGELRRAVLANMAEEKGLQGIGQSSPEHAELWLDFAEGMGARRDQRGHEPSKEIKDLMIFFHNVARNGSQCARSIRAAGRGNCTPRQLPFVSGQGWSPGFRPLADCR